MGFLNKPWNAAPAMERLAPTNTPNKTLGSLMVQIIASWEAGKSSMLICLFIMGIFDSTILNTSIDLMSAVPNTEKNPIDRIRIADNPKSTMPYLFLLIFNLIPTLLK